MVTRPLWAAELAPYPSGALGRAPETLPRRPAAAAPGPARGPGPLPAYRPRGPARAATSVTAHMVYHYLTEVSKQPEDEAQVVAMDVGEKAAKEALAEMNWWNVW